MMNYNNTQAARIAEIFNELTQIDKDMKNLNDRAEFGIESDGKSMIHLCAPDGHDDDSGIAAGFAILMVGKAAKRVKCLRTVISDKASLQIIGILISTKSQEKKLLQEELLEYGIKIEQ
jgi:hypothetical protein